MRSSPRLVPHVGHFLSVGIVAVAVGFLAQPAKGQTTATARLGDNEKWTVTTSPGRGHPGRPYFIEFRARSAASYGHMYVLYGKVNGRDEIVESRIAGLHPAGDANDCFNCSVFNWTIGHLVPVPSETGASDGDLEEKYVTARYRVWLTPVEFKKVDAYIKKLQADNPTWNALWNNCVGFGRNIAEYMGLKVPAFIWLEPEDFVNGLREENGMAKEQLPLKDAAAGSAARTAAAHVTPLPPHKPKAQPVGTTSQPALKPAPAKKKQPVAGAAPAASPQQSTLASIFRREQRMTFSAEQ
jgi:hypothetical protein